MGQTDGRTDDWRPRERQVGALAERRLNGRQALPGSANDKSRLCDSRCKLITHQWNYYTHLDFGRNSLFLLFRPLSPPFPHNLQAVLGDVIFRGIPPEALPEKACLDSGVTNFLPPLPPANFATG